MNVELTDLENPADQRNLVAFRLDQQIYALPIELIVQIIEMVTITPIPQASNTVEGVINVRGAPVPTINLRRHLGLPNAPLQLHTPIVLVQVGEQMVGLIVDEVLDVLSLRGDQITRPANILPEGLGEALVLQGVAYVQNDTVLLLDLEHLFLPHQARALVQAVETLPEVIESIPSVDEGKETSEELPVETQPEDVVEEASEETHLHESDREIGT
jgi:purine-binding chemotaxis protein CheW